MSNYRKIQAEDCPCREGMFPRGKVSRRGLLFAVGSTVGVSSASLVRPALAAALSAPPGSIRYDVAADPTKEQGRPTFEDGGYGSRSQFETAVRLLAPNPNPNTTFTPLADLLGNITPSGLHFERHHAGIPVIDPAKHSLVIHGLVGTPKRFTMADIRRMPSVTRKHFIECSGNTLSGWTGQMEKTVQASHGLLSTSDWTGVLFSEFAKQVGLKPEGTWVLAEGSDGAVMTRSIPMEKMLRDAILAYGQNGEAIRPEQGYPLRLVLPSTAIAPRRSVRRVPLKRNSPSPGSAGADDPRRRLRERSGRTALRPPRALSCRWAFKRSRDPGGTNVVPGRRALTQPERR